MEKIKTFFKTLWETYHKRVKTYLFNVFYVAIVAGLNVLLTDYTSWDLPPWAIGLIGLLLSQISKELNNRFGNPK